MPSRILTELLTQHEGLRALMMRCEQLAEELDSSRGDPALLAREVARLRVAFNAHNRYEEQFLRPVLANGDGFGDVRVDRMVAEHVAEHRLVGGGLVDAITGELRLAIDRLRGHLAAEERHFLTSQVLRDDLVVVEGSA